MQQEQANPPQHILVLVTPPLLTRWLSQRMKQRDVLFLDCEFDALDDERLKLDLDIAFSPIIIRRGMLERADFYVGSTGAIVEVSAPLGAVRECTPSVAMPVDYSNSVKYVRQSSVEVKPEIEAEDGQVKAKGSLGSARLEAGVERTYTSSYTGAERTLQVVDLGNTVRWIVSLPRGEKVVMDFLAGNLYLYAVLEWHDGGGQGTIVARPSDIRFFDRDKRPIDRIGTYGMALALWLRRRRARHPDGLEVSFVVERVQA